MSRERSSSSNHAVDPIDWIKKAGVQAEIAAGLKQRRTARRRKAIGVAAGLCCVVVVGVWAWWEQTSGRAPAVPASVVVSAPERRVLSDGSWVELKDDAEIRVEYDGAMRRVELVKGLAYFQVAREATRPFVVRMGTVDVRALGTAFSVERRKDQVSVLVTEGKISLEKSDSRASDPIIVTASDTVAILDAGKRTVVHLRPQSPTPVIENVTPKAMESDLAWRIPILDFSDTPLEQAVRLINRHSKRKVVLRDPQLASLPLTGVLRADNVEMLREVLRDTYGIISEQTGEFEVTLRK